MSPSPDADDLARWDAARALEQAGPGDGAAPPGSPLAEAGDVPVDLTAGDPATGDAMPFDLELPAGEEPAAATPTVIRDRARAARRQAERAIEDQAVPPRYHRLIRRYFGRLEEAAERSAAPPSPPASPPPSPPSPPPASGGNGG